METEPIRFTTNSYGTTLQQRSLAEVPPAVVISPLLSNIEYTKTKLCKCTQCNAFICPSSNVDLQTRTWKCNFCNTMNNLPIENINIQDNCELESTDLKPSKTMIIIDGTSSAISTGLLPRIYQDLETLLAGKITNVCVALLTDTLNVLGPNGSISTFVDLEDSIIPPKYFLKELPSLALFQKYHGTRKGPYTVSALETAIKSVGPGGRVFAAVSYRSDEKKDFKVPSMQAEAPSLRGVNYEELSPLITLYKQFNVNLSMLIAPGGSTLIDCASFARFCSETGGRCEYISKTGFNTFYSALERFFQPRLTCKLYLTGAETILPSLGTSQHSHTHFSVLKGESLVFPFGFKQENVANVHAQLVITKFDLDGSSSIYVNNKTITNTSDLQEIFRNCDQNAILKYITNSLINLFLIDTEIDHLKELCLAFLKPIFMSYRVNVSRSPRRLSSIVLPKSLDWLVVRCLGILKSTVFMQCISYDERAVQMSLLSAKPPEAVALCGYPKLKDITAFVWHGGEITERRLMESQCTKGKLLLLDNGFSTWLWLGDDLDKDLVLKTFGKPAQSLVEELVQIDTEQNERLFSVMYGNLRMMKQSTQSETTFTQRMVEDSHKRLPSSSDFMHNLHTVTLPQRSEEKVTNIIWKYAKSFFMEDTD